MLRQARDVWESEAAAKDWLQSPVRALGGKTPVELLCVDVYQAGKTGRTPSIQLRIMYIMLNRMFGCIAHARYGSCHCHLFGTDVVRIPACASQT
ncbi:MbcA/ParS/Xre antitoxin family protein [Marinobacter hydrocarbonoclasticus]|nr:MbcA/ParS/Xre antitoxin family protein [Marinobacter nauticus]MBY6103002.1 MbcA/ParS/Xre antitoxin family protein [Marinobacter nauticus]